MRSGRMLIAAASSSRTCSPVMKRDRCAPLHHAGASSPEGYSPPWVSVFPDTVAIVATAAAHRSPSSKEARAIRAAVTKYLKSHPNVVAADYRASVRVKRIRVSRADRNYAAAFLRSRDRTASVVLWRNSSDWRVILGPGTDFFCSDAPRVVLIDLLGSCSGSSNP
jgi:hypothetical protein